jgi:hypothetical protein
MNAFELRLGAGTPVLVPPLAMAIWRPLHPALLAHSAQTLRGDQELLMASYFGEAAIAPRQGGGPTA